jgi:hypothetical protein
VNDWLDRFETDIQARAARRGWARAYVEVCEAGASSPEERATDVALLAALIGDPARLEPVRRRYATWQQHLHADAGDAVDATIVRLAADGLWLADLMNLAPPQGDLRHDVIARLAAFGGR